MTLNKFIKKQSSEVHADIGQKQRVTLIFKDAQVEPTTAPWTEQPHKDDALSQVSEVPECQSWNLNKHVPLANVDLCLPLTCTPKQRHSVP